MTNANRTEYPIWGKPPNSDTETLLHSLATSEEEAKRVMQVLMTDHGCRDMRIQVLRFDCDLSLDWKN